MKFSNWWTSIIFVILLFAGMTLFGANFGFGAQCTKAGYVGADHELCVKRASKGGPIYVENVEKLDKQ